jgi:hypothetical protein
MAIEKIDDPGKKGKRQQCQANEFYAWHVDSPPSRILSALV